MSGSATPCTVAHQPPLRWDSLGKNAGVGSRAHLHRIFPAQGSNPCLLHLHLLRWQEGSLPKSAKLAEAFLLKGMVLVSTGDFPHNAFFPKVPTGLTLDRLCSPFLSLNTQPRQNLFQMCTQLSLSHALLHSSFLDT